jgi:UDP-glucose 4-epimerase
VTGGAGFIGSHLVDALIGIGYEVLVIDNLSTGKESNLNPEAKFVRMDILDESLPDKLRDFKPDVVFHHAAQVAVAHSIKQPLFDAKVNIMGTLNVLKACAAAEARKLIYASSAAVYGMPQSPTISESHAISPLSFYGISKHTPEHYIETYAQLLGLDYSVLRYANVFGSRQDAQGEGGVVSIFASKLLAGERPAIFGDGEQTRDFIHVSNIVSANLAAIRAGGGKVMNVGCNASTSVNELLRIMCELCGRPFAPEYREARPGDIVHSVLNNELAMRELGWRPEVSLRDGLIETVGFYRDELRRKREVS